MKKLKMSLELKQLLALQGAKDETIELVENYFNSQAEALVEHSKPEQPEQQPETPRSKQEMAKQARLIK